jgi:hypothetical protein
MRKPIVPSPETITPTTPLRLDIAAQIAFPDGSVTARALRTEAVRGNLDIETIANKQFTTLQAIEDMRKKCRVNQRGQGSGLSQPNTMSTVRSSDTQHGSSVMDRAKSHGLP